MCHTTPRRLLACKWAHLDHHLQAHDAPARSHFRRFSASGTTDPTFRIDRRNSDEQQNWNEEKERKRSAVTGRKGVTSFVDGPAPPLHCPVAWELRGLTLTLNLTRAGVLTSDASIATQTAATRRPVRALRALPRYQCLTQREKTGV